MRKESDDEVEARATVEAEALPDNPVPRVAEVVPGVPGTQPLPAPAPGNRPLTAMMALPEPQRTREMEQAVQAGRPYTIRSTTGRVVRVRYGEHVLEVPPEGCQFMAPHAIHLLWSARGRVEEVG
jgi:hypothetical protein